MARPATIRIFLADGTPEGLRIIEKSLWTGRGFDFARAEWTRVRSRDDFAKPGVYVLSGPADDGTTIIYVGEADELRSRLNLHHGSLDFWTRAIAFVSKDENLNKAGVKYLESRLVALATDAKRAALKNGNVPGAPFMSEADRAEAEGFLEEMLPIYPLMGITAFEVVQVSAADPQSVRLHLNRAGIVAYGRDIAEGFVVEAGSAARSGETKGLHQYVRTLRSKLLADGVLVADGPQLRVASDYVFGSPSTAAAVILGSPANGRTEWTDEQGRMLKTIQEKAAE
ncbi:MAG: GIY-YIG nuclease family protein [Candidatus Limnocylindria bacterium]